MRSGRSPTGSGSEYTPASGSVYFPSGVAGRRGLRGGGARRRRVGCPARPAPDGRPWRRPRPAADPQPRRAGGAPDGDAGEGHERSIRGNGRPGDPRPHGRGCQGHEGTMARGTRIEHARDRRRGGDRRGALGNDRSPAAGTAPVRRGPHEGARHGRSGSRSGTTARGTPGPERRRAGRHGRCPVHTQAAHPRHTRARPAEPKSTGSGVRGVVHRCGGGPGEAGASRYGGEPPPSMARSVGGATSHTRRDRPRPPVPRRGFRPGPGSQSRPGGTLAGLSRGPESGAHDDDRHIREP